jgi:hypothetical protein
LTQIDAIRTDSACSAIFSILKIDLLNIDSPPIALRKVVGDWGLFAGELHRVAQVVLSASDKKMGWGDETTVSGWRHRVLGDCRLRPCDGG